MGTTTTNYSLYKPDVGATGWGADRNTSYDTIDAQMKSNADAAAAATAHATADGSSHTFIDQSVVSGAAPTFTADNLSDGGGNAIITTTQETNFEAAYTHVSSDGSDHTFLDQSVVSGATPTFGADNFSDGGSNAIITTTQETNFETAYTHASSTGSDHSLVNSSLVSTINFIIDGGGSAIATGIKGDIEIPFACTINQVTLLADQSTTTTIDIWKDTYANYPPTDADSITAAAVPGIAAGLKDQDATLTGWTTSITAGDILRFNVDANDNAERVTIALKVTKT